MLDEKLLITPFLLRRFEAEAHVDGGDGRHYALIRRPDGDFLSHHPGSPMLDPAQSLWTGDVLRLLNRELHHDGAWVCVWTHPMPVPLESVIHINPHSEYGRYALIWLDQDGDPQFTVEWERGITTDLQDFAAVLLQGINATAQKAEAAWQIWRTYMREVLDPQPDQLIRRAQGELPKAANG